MTLHDQSSAHDCCKSHTPWKHANVCKSGQSCDSPMPWTAAQPDSVDALILDHYFAATSKSKLYTFEPSSVWRPPNHLHTLLQ